MNPFVRPVPLVLAVAAIAAFVLGQPLLGALGVVMWAGALAVSSIRHSASQRASTDYDEGLSAEGRALLTPSRRLLTEIEEIVAGQPPGSARALGQEALAESRRIVEGIAHALALRSRLLRSLDREATAEREAARLEAEASLSSSPAEREALESALEARRLEMSHYAEARAALPQIEAGVRQAEAALSEMRARIAVGAVERSEAATSGEDLRETLSRMRALSLSYNEVEDMLGVEQKD